MRRAASGLVVACMVALIVGGCASASQPPPVVEATLAPGVPPTSTSESRPTPVPTATAIADAIATTGPTATLAGTLVPSLATPSPTAVATPATRLLDVPLHQQEHALSCEAAALEMALGTLGHQVTEDELLAGLARDPTPRTVKADGRVQWGDPDVGFVGRFDGVFARDGYGVYQAPIAALARDEGFEGSTPLSDAEPGDLYDAVRDGYPVVVWMPYRGQVKGRGAWTTPAGKPIDYVVTEHAVVLAGVAEDGVTYADPYTATLEHMSFDAFEAANAELGGRAVIVRP